MTTPTSSSQLVQGPANRPQHIQQYVNNNVGSVKIVAGYALQQRLGSGSFATVYKGAKVPVDDSQGQPSVPPATAATTAAISVSESNVVAIKAIMRSSEKLTKKVLENLEMEISILRTYRHPNIVCLHDVQKTERHFYLILEYCGGGDVQRLIRTRKAGRLSERLARRLMMNLSAGLKFLWGQELIHRDIKPQNLLLTGPLPLEEKNDPAKLEADEEMRRRIDFPSSSFALKIADFGFARHLQTASLAETLCGSPLYMAPEILQHQRYDAKADLWSVGTVLFEMIAGRPPFHGENHIDLLRNIQRKAVRLPADVRVSKECVTLLRLLLNRNPLSRAGFKEFFEACNAFVALGCEGVDLSSTNEGTYNQPGKMDLGTISETDESAVQGVSGFASNETSVSAQHALQSRAVLTHAENSSKSISTSNPQSSQQPDHKENSLTTPSSQSRGRFPRFQEERRSCVTPPLEPVATVAPAPPNTPPKFATADTSEQIVNTAKRYSHFAPLEPSPPGPQALKNIEFMNNAIPPFQLDGVNTVTAMPLVPQKKMGQHQQPMLLPPQNSQYVMARSPFQPQDNHDMHDPSPSSRNESSQNSDDSEFVMVEHGGNSRSGSLSPSTSSTRLVGLGSKKDQIHQTQQRRRSFLTWNQSQNNQLIGRGRMTSLSPPASPRGYSSNKHIIPGRRGSGSDQTIMGRVASTRGMLSTSPGTGGAIVGMMGGLMGGDSPKAITGNSHQDSSTLETFAKMLAAAEDVGRRAVNVAHLGDTRAYIGMRQMVMNDEGSSLLSATPMEGVEEEEEEDKDGVTNGEDTRSYSTHLAATVRRRTVSSDRSTNANRTPEDDDEDTEMPFAVTPTDEATIPSSARVSARPSSSAVISCGSITNSKPRATVSTVRALFREALSCYVKALSMMKGAVNAARMVMNELGGTSPPISATVDPNNPRILLSKRCEVSLNWLTGQFTGVLERADAANTELGKLQSSQAFPPAETSEMISMVSVEELIYNHALTCGRDGAVKQLLGQYDAARACYRSAGLLAETLLMEPRLEDEDRKVLEDYVHGFAERITELDQLMIQQRRHSIGSSSGQTGSAVGSRRGSGIISLVGPPPSPGSAYGVVGATMKHTNIR